MQLLYLHRDVKITDSPSIYEIYQKQQDMSMPVSEPETYNKLPPYYSGLDTWPTSCNIRCWSCGCFFTSVPIFVPVTTSRTSGGQLSCTREGVECSFVCSNTHIFDKYNHDPQKGSQLRQMLRLLYTDMTGLQAPAIFPKGPNKFDSVEYGGCETEQQIKSSISRLEQSY
jgi:hypothetical protein